ncbi:MAG: hypothetical protein MUD07_00045 [Burkholderiaceae bacterium]|jgi:hypothetical protein|nr:hypothetical protein [Burkholderiaceae bacterium]
MTLDRPMPTLPPARPAQPRPTRPVVRPEACAAAAATQLDETERDRLRSIALSSWENEGGADAAHSSSRRDDPLLAGLRVDTAESEQLRVRVIALENLLVALLAEAPARQLTLAREMASFISPRPGCTPHPLTLRAADEMLSLVDRADRFSSSAAS